MRIAYLTTDSVVEGIGQSQILPYVRKLANQGNEVSLISFEKRQPPTELSDELRRQGILWTPKEFGRNGLIEGGRRMIEIALSIEKCEVVHARSDVPAVAAFLNRQKIPYLWDVRSLWALQRYETSNKNVASKIKYLIGTSLEAIAANNCAAFSVLTRKMVPYLRNKYPNLPTVYDVNPTFVDLELFKPKNQKITKTINCLISGTINSFYDIPEINRTIKDISISIPLKSTWARGFESGTVSNSLRVDLVTQLNRQQMPKIIQASNFGILISKKNLGDSIKAVSPTKVAEFFASGRPIVVNEGIGDLDDQIREFRAGVILKGNESPNDIAEEILTLIRDSETTSRCRSLAEKYYGIDDAVSRYTSIYRKIA